jgi:hypothetical protein
MFEIIPFWVVCALLCAFIASSKGINGFGWFLLGLLLGPFGVLFVLFDKASPKEKGEVKCPFCAEYIKKEAVVCKHCKSSITDQIATGNQ